MHRLGLRSPAEAEAEYYHQHAEPTRGQAHHAGSVNLSV